MKACGKVRSVPKPSKIEIGSIVRWNYNGSRSIAIVTNTVTDELSIELVVLMSRGLAAHWVGGTYKASSSHVTLFEGVIELENKEGS